MFFNNIDLLSTVLTLPGVIIAITFHEFAHAFVADKLGDDTPRNQGRLSLNPINHIDPFGFILLIFAHFGWGKPVQINPRNFNRDLSMKKGEVLVSIAGPATNFILSIILSIIYCLIYTILYQNNIEVTKIMLYVMYAIQYAIVINIGLGVFNLLPLPPLDGSKIFKNIMPYKFSNWLENNERLFYGLFLVIWITGIASIIISPVINFIYTYELGGVGLLFGLNLF